MFYVWSATGTQAAYQPGTLERRRRVERVHGPDAATAVAPRSGDAGHDGAPGPHADAIASYHHGEQTRAVRQPAVTAAQIMTAPVVTLAPDATLDEAWQLFRTRRFRHVPIAAANGTVAGILSDRDLMREALARAAGPPATWAASVREVMATDVLTARPEATIRQVARVLFDERIGAMPIVDASGVLAGILTRSDILRAVLGSAPLELWI